MAFITRRALLAAALLAGAALQSRATGRQDAVPSHPPVPPPDAKGVVVLFGGTQADLDAHWTMRSGTPAAWKIQPGGSMMTSGGDIMTKERFQDYQLHVEFKVPYMPEAKGQARGNSGVFMQGRYEIQVLDSYGLPDPGTGDCGAVYSKAAPLVNACRKPLEWQTYDISFRAPRFDSDGKMTEKPRVSVWLNGTAVQNNTEIDGPTWGEKFGAVSDPGPIVLQFHGNQVEYRNVWILPLPPHGATHY